MARRLAASLLLALSAGTVAISQDRAVTGLILGTVVDSTGAGVPRATVQLTGRSEDFLFTRRVMADEHGEFFFADLSRGEYMVSATKPGYVEGSWGQRRPSTTQRWLGLTPGERRTDMAVTVWKHGVVTGTVTDETGAPVAGADVAAYRPAIVAGRLRFESVRSTATDDRGEFRIHSLTPDDYCIVFTGGKRAATFDDPDSPGRQRTFVYPTVVHPAPIAGRPQALITIAPGAVTSGIDFRVSPVAGVNVTGAVRGGDGLPQTNLRLVTQPLASIPGLEIGAPLHQMRADGRFAFSPVVPGSYTLGAIRTGYEPANPADAFPPMFAASLPVIVGASDVDVASVNLQPAARMTGRLVFQGEAPPASKLRELIDVGLHRADAVHGPGLPRVKMTGGHEFTTSGLLPGSYLFYVDNPQEAWWLQTVTVAGRDIGRLPMEVGAADVSDVSLILSPRATIIDGTIELAAGQSIRDVDVLAFSADRRRWVDTGPYGSPASATPASPDGRFSIHVGPGDYFVLATRTDLGRLWQAPAMLARLSALAQQVNVPAGQRISVSLRVQDVR